MFAPFQEEITDIAFIFAHAGKKTEKGNRLYAVCARIYDSGGKKRDYESLVRYKGFTQRERHFSGLTKDAVQNAPPLKQVHKELRAFLHGIRVAMVLDTDDIIPHLEKLLPDIRFIHLGFAAEYFIPELGTAASRPLWEYLYERQRNRTSFPANEMTALSAELVIHITGRILNDSLHPEASAIRHFLFSSNTLFGKVFHHLAKNHQGYFGGMFASVNVPDTDAWHAFLEKCTRKNEPKEKKEESSKKKVSRNQCKEIFQTLDKSVKGFQLRKEQAEYAMMVADALNEEAVLTIEAGTGTGKTLGYLVPAFLHLMANPGARIVISTYTKNLQEQILMQEVALLHKQVPGFLGVPAVVLKGKSSYVCVQKLDAFSDASLTGKDLLSWLYFLILAFRFKHADCDAVGETVMKYFSGNPLFEQLRHEVSSRNGCPPSHTFCPAQVVTEQAKNARLVITNHYKLTLLDNDPILADLFYDYIIDEANHFENAIRKSMGIELSSREVRQTIEPLKEMLLRVLPRAAGQALDQVKKVLAFIDDLKKELDTLHKSLSLYGKKRGNNNDETLDAEEKAFAQCSLDENIADILGLLKAIHRDTQYILREDTARMLRLHMRSAKRAESLISFLQEHFLALSAIRERLEKVDSVCSYSLYERNWILYAASVEVSGLVQENILAKKNTIVFTGATLTTNGKFDNFMDICGLGKETKNPPVRRKSGKTIEDNEEEEEKPLVFRYSCIPSPFRNNRFRILVHPEAVNGSYGNKDRWLETIIRLIPKLVMENQGSTLVLFASYEDMEKVSTRLSEHPFTYTYPLLVQERGKATFQLCNAFRGIRESVLFGVDTFWYGVDFPGDTLTQVIITRIPYPRMTDPLQLARRKALPDKQFWQRYRYESDIKMKQGIGRLIRTHTDKGRVIILDSRYRG